MNKVILVGKAAAGKDHMRKVMESRGFVYGISFTTRPPREGEVHGKDYYFLTVEEFEQKIKEDFWYEYVTFNGWYYGTSKDQFYNTCNLFIMTPIGVSHIKPEDRGDCTIFYIDIPIEVRRERLLSRHMPGDSLDRRIEADENDFKNFTDYDIKINNPNF
jgi:guanylate kinase